MTAQCKTQRKQSLFDEGQLVDAIFTTAPRQSNTREENEKIKKGEGDDLWDNHPHKKPHQDIDARWTKKNKKHKQELSASWRMALCNKV